MTEDTVFAIFSTTKAITGTAVPAAAWRRACSTSTRRPKEYAPRIGKLQVLTGFDAAGNPQLRPPRTRHHHPQLLLHTAGLGYDFFNETYNRLANEHGQPSVVTATRASITTPLLFDPGERWEYGIEHRLGRPGGRGHPRQAPRRCDAGSASSIRSAWSTSASP